MSEDKKIKLEFAPGCFDNFDGTQEELDEFIAEIQRMADSGELQQQAVPIDMDDPDEEAIEAISQMLSIELDQAQRKLQ
jgi:hypothetical protein